VKKSKFSERGIVGILKEVDLGANIDATCRESSRFEIGLQILRMEYCIQAKVIRDYYCRRFAAFTWRQ
jgi:hypothetical protein